MSLDCSNPCHGTTINSSEIAPLVYLQGVDIQGCKKWEPPNTMICRVFANLPVSGAAPPGTKFIGTDCRAYDAPALVETPLIANDSSTVDFTIGGPANHTLTAIVKVSAAPGNQIVVNGDGLFVDVTALDACAAIQGFPVAPSVPVGGNVVYSAGGICGLAPLPVETPFVANSSASIIGAAGGPNGHSPTYTARISAVAGNQLSVNPDGLFVPAAAAETPLTANDSATVDFTTSGPASHTLTASVKISSLPGNSIVAAADGIYAINTCDAIFNFDTATDLTVPPTAEVVYMRLDGTCGRAPLPAAPPETPFSAIDSQTIDFTTSGVNGHTLTGSVVLSPNAGNTLTALPNGLFVPTFDFCGTLATRPAAPGPFVAGVTRLLGTDCNYYTIPPAANADGCTVGASITGGTGTALRLIGQDINDCLVRVGNCDIFAPLMIGNSPAGGVNSFELIARDTGSFCPRVVRPSIKVSDPVTTPGLEGQVWLGQSGIGGQLNFTVPPTSGIGVLTFPNNAVGSVDVLIGIDPCNGWNVLLPTAAGVVNQVVIDSTGCLAQTPVVAGYSPWQVRGDNPLAVEVIGSGETLTVLGGTGLNTTITGTDQLTVSIDRCDLLPLAPESHLDINSFLVLDANNCLARIDVTETCLDDDVQMTHGLGRKNDTEGWVYGRFVERKTVHVVNGPVYNVDADRDNVLICNNSIPQTINLPKPTFCQRLDFHIKLNTDPGGQPVTLNAFAGDVIIPGTGAPAPSLVISGATGRESYHLVHSGVPGAAEWHIL